MTEPRSLTFADRWLTDSRVYNLIWLGRWLERAETTSRVVNDSAQSAMGSGSDPQVFQQLLETAASTRGIPIDDPARVLAALLRDNQASSIYHCLYNARSNATQIGTVELIRAISALVVGLENEGPLDGSPEAAQRVTNGILEGLNQVYKVIDDSWFHREPLSEEEMYRRFVQQ